MEMNNDFPINIPPKNGQNADAFNEFKQTTIYDQNLIKGTNKKVKGLKVKSYINFIYFSLIYKLTNILTRKNLISKKKTGEHLNPFYSIHLNLSIPFNSFLVNFQL